MVSTQPFASAHKLAQPTLNQPNQTATSPTDLFMKPVEPDRELLGEQSESKPHGFHNRT